MKVVDRVKGFLEEHSIGGCSVLVAVSGGIDSTVLLHSLVASREEFDLDLSVAHLNHGLRGEDSARDAEFVAELAEGHGLSSRIEGRPVEEHVENEGLSPEEAARKVRYEFLSEAAEAEAADHVALGHNADDQAETILMNVIRGTGLQGLGGMEEVRGAYIRPLLEIPRAEIASYARAEGLDYRQDETNSDTSYLRNRLRHELIPELEESYNPRIKEKLRNLGRLARGARSFVEERASAAAERARTEEGPGTCFRRADLSGLHPHLKKATIRRFIAETKGDLKDVTSDHVGEVVGKLEENPARTRLDLPGLTFTLQYGRGCFFTDYEPETVTDFSYGVEPEEKLQVAEAKMELEFELTTDPERMKPGRFSSDSLTEVVDWAKVERPLVVRNREPGDRFVPLGMDGKKKLKDYFIDAKVPHSERDEVPLVCDRKGIIWVVGHRMDERYKLDESSKKGMIMKARQL